MKTPQIICPLCGSKNCYLLKNTIKNSYFNINNKSFSINANANLDENLSIGASINYNSKNINNNISLLLDNICFCQNCISFFAIMDINNKDFIMNKEIEITSESIKEKLLKLFRKILKIEDEYTKRYYRILSIKRNLNINENLELRKYLEEFWSHSFVVYEKDLNNLKPKARFLVLEIKGKTKKFQIIIEYFFDGENNNIFSLKKDKLPNFNKIIIKEESSIKIISPYRTYNSIQEFELRELNKILNYLDPITSEEVVLLLLNELKGKKIEYRTDLHKYLALIYFELFKTKLNLIIDKELNIFFKSGYYGPTLEEKFEKILLELKKNSLIEITHNKSVYSLTKMGENEAKRVIEELKKSNPYLLNEFRDYVKNISEYSHEELIRYTYKFFIRHYPEYLKNSKIAKSKLNRKEYQLWEKIREGLGKGILEKAEEI